jgi:hypothetical protein
MRTGPRWQRAPGCILWNIVMGNTQRRVVRQPTKRRVEFTARNHGVKVKRGFNEVFLTWRAIRELDRIRRTGRVSEAFQ